MSSNHVRTNSITAMDFIESQTRLEEEARELLPYNPDHCTFHDGSIRQQLFVCMTCKQKNHPKQNAICYSCSIQCHSDHELVELFTKRGFSCDCGTERMASFGGCNLRKNFDSLDRPEPTNVYGQNFDGKFCSCSSTYEPLKEQGVMFQCLLGDVCNEDWYHEECILGLPRGSVNRVKREQERKDRAHPQGVNMLDSMEPATSENVKRPEESASAGGISDNEDNEEEDDEEETLEGLPNQSEFDAFVCWRCINKHRVVFNKIKDLRSVALEPVIHGDFPSLEDRERYLQGRALKSRDRGDVSVSAEQVNDIKNEGQNQDQANRADDQEPATKKIKLDVSEGQEEPKKEEKEEDNSPSPAYSLFLKEGYQEILANSTDPDFKRLVAQFPFMAQEEDVYEPEPDDDANSSLLDAGTRALNSIPREQAINGLHAYEQIRSRLSNFLRPFAEQGKVVTESDVTGFFDKVKEEQEKNRAF